MLVSWRDIEQARDTIKGCGVVVRTPLLRNAEQMFGFDDQFKLHLKMENMQNTGMVKELEGRGRLIIGFGDDFPTVFRLSFTDAS